MSRLRTGPTPSDEEEVVEPEPLVPGVARALSPMVRRIVADNAGMMTGPGTNTYLVGIDEVVVVDPGPDDDAHLEAILGCGGDRIRWIALTHTHPDHAPGAAKLKERTGAEVLTFARRDGVKPDRKLADGDTIEATEFRMRAIHTPGHASNHLCYLVEEERMLLSGDHVIEGSTVLIKPPDGDMGAYLASLERIRSLRLRSIAPGHGQLIDQPAAVIDWYIQHRLRREEKVVSALEAASGPVRIDDIVGVVYDDVTEDRLAVARLSLHAHLLKLVADGRATGRNLTGTWELVA